MSRIKGFLRAAWNTARDAFNDDLPMLAAAIAFYGVLSFFPLIIGIVSAAAFFVDREQVLQLAFDAVNRAFPAGAELVHDTLAEIIELRGEGGLLAVAALLWSGGKAFGTLTAALNKIYRAPSGYGYFRQALLQFKMSLSVGALFFTMLIASTATPLITSFFPQMIEDLLARTIELILPSAMLFAAFFVLYRFVPNADQHRISSLWGAATATALFVAVRPGFRIYIQKFADYNVVYGSLGIAAGLLMWAWILALITLLGAEVAAHVRAARAGMPRAEAQPA